LPISVGIPFRTISNLVEMDLVTREAVPDNRRLLSIDLTDKGKELFSGIESSLERYYQDVYSSLPDDKREQVLESLEILVKTLPEQQCC
jgi:DNA-binding MarR family transcriptional regulator